MIRVCVAIALSSRQEVVELEMADGSTVADAIAAAKPESLFPGIDLAAVEAGIWGSRVAMGARLRDGDRVELYRPLTADPKDQRRRRARPKPSSRARNEP